MAFEILMALAIIPTFVFLMDIQIRLSNEVDQLDKSTNESNKDDENINQDENIKEMAVKINNLLNMSILQVALSFILLLVSILLTWFKQENKFGILLPPLFNQFALMALLPLAVLQTPVFPLQSLNLALTVAFTITNFVLFVQ